MTLLGIINLSITIYLRPFEKNMMLDFIVVDEINPYQMILGRSFMKVSQLIMSIYYLALKYQMNTVVRVVNEDQRVVRSYYAIAVKDAIQVVL